MQAIHSLCVSLLLPFLALSEFPAFGPDNTVCQEDACTNKYINSLLVERTVTLPNRSVTYTEQTFVKQVDVVGLLADCAPSTSIWDVATDMKSCEGIPSWYYYSTWACKYRKKGWLAIDGMTINETVLALTPEIEGVSENIAKCLEWAGDYDSYFSGHHAKKQKKILKKIGFESMPSWRTLRKLECVEMAITFGLEACAKKIFQGVPEIWINN